MENEIKFGWREKMQRVRWRFACQMAHLILDEQIVFLVLIEEGQI